MGPERHAQRPRHAEGGATDQDQHRATSPGVDVTLKQASPTITSPADHAALSGTSSLSYQLFAPGITIDRVEASVYDDATGFSDIVGSSTTGDGAIQIDVSGLGDTTTGTLTVSAWDDDIGAYLHDEIPVAVGNP